MAFTRNSFEFAAMDAHLHQQNELAIYAKKNAVKPTEAQRLTIEQVQRQLSGKAPYRLPDQVAALALDSGTAS